LDFGVLGGAKSEEAIEKVENILKGYGRVGRSQKSDLACYCCCRTRMKEEVIFLLKLRI